jgi:hypothetical protein
MLSASVPNVQFWGSGSGSTGAIGPMSMDAFSRIKTSNPFTLFDSQNRYISSNTFFSNTVGGGVVGYNQGESTVLLTTNTTSSNVVRQSKLCFPYQPGKSLTVMTSFVMAPLTTGVVQRVGYFNSLNGIFIELSDQLYICKRNAGVDTKVPQMLWNSSTLNGILDISKCQIMWLDLQWLGVGSVRVGFVVDGQMILAHQFNHSNKTTGVYMTTAILPVRYEIFNTGTTAACTLKQICSTVSSDGGYQGRLSPMYSVQHGTTRSATDPFHVIATAGQTYPLICIRLVSGFTDAIVRLTCISIMVIPPTGNSTDLISWYVILNPTLTGSSWTAHATSSFVEYDTSVPTFTAGTGTIISRGMASSSSVFNYSPDENIQLGIRDFGVSDVLMLGVAGSAQNVMVGVQLGWSEF